MICFAAIRFTGMLLLCAYCKSSVVSKNHRLFYRQNSENSQSIRHDICIYFFITSSAFLSEKVRRDFALKNPQTLTFRSICGISLFVFRENNGNLRTLIFLAFKGNSTLMEDYPMLYYGKTKSCAAGFS